MVLSSRPQVLPGCHFVRNVRAMPCDSSTRVRSYTGGLKRMRTWWHIGCVLLSYFSRRTPVPVRWLLITLRAGVGGASERGHTVSCSHSQSGLFVPQTTMTGLKLLPESRSLKPSVVAASRYALIILSSVPPHAASRGRSFFWFRSFLVTRGDGLPAIHPRLEPTDNLIGFHTHTRTLKR